ncbi:helix-turn-helix domain-containing protein [Streptomyces brasiliscabiei]|uniref:Helix-turn-helix domain-containing protein n=1 Tax=Streptomyces brasiliscabiei TaxID=2736302 RepID=A0ABU8GVN0_9ACTN
MLAKVFDSRDLPAGDRIEAWSELTERALAPNLFRIHDPSRFRATLRAVDMGEVQVTALTYSALRSWRTPRLIRRSDPAGYTVGLILRGSHGILQERREASLGAHELLVYSDSRPYEAAADVGSGTAATVLVQVPRQSLPLRPTQVDRLLAVALPGRDESMGGLLTALLTRLATSTGPWVPQDTVRVGDVLLDLLTAWLAHHIDVMNPAVADARQRVQFLEIRTFVLNHLGDPDLSPNMIAAAHHMSLRTLQRLFREQGSTVAAFIRRQRLRRVCRDLADPRLAARPIHVIAARWGWSRPSDLTRAFRAAYGVGPAEYRHTHLARAGNHGGAR